MRQLTLASASFDKHSKQTRRAKFLAEMDQVVPWREMCAVVEPFYPRAGNGRPPIGLERMLRLHLLQHWFNLSDPAAEEALYDSLSMRRFVGIDLGREPVPDETTILNFRHLLERHDLGKLLFDRVNQHLASRGLKVAGGTIVDATIIAAPSSTKNEAKARDPEISDAEGSAVVFRDEATHRGGQQDQADPLDGDHRGEHARRKGAWRVAARRRDAGIWRSGLSGAEGRDP